MAIPTLVLCLDNPLPFGRSKRPHDADESSFASCCSSAALIAIRVPVKVQNTEPEPPPRPSNVPAKAIWAGGLDGGDFILLTPATSAGTYSAKIYNEHSAISSSTASSA